MRSLKKKVIYFLLMLMTLSCSDVKKKTGKNVDKNIADEIVDQAELSAETTATSNKKIDTLHIKKRVYFLNVISKYDFAKIPNPKRLKTSSGTKNVTIHDSTSLAFSFINGADSLFINNFEDEWSKYAVYNLVKDFSEINYWLVHVILYEGDAMFLLNKTNGKVKWVYSEPILSPNRKYFITYSADLEAQYNENGIQLFKVDGKEIEELWTKDIDAWEPSEIKWQNDSIIAIKQTHFDWENPKNIHVYKYKTIKIINTHNIN